MENRGFVLMGAAASAAVLALCVLTPLLFPYGHFTGLDGNPGMLDHGWSLSESIYLLGDFLCHQQESRSFVINGSQMPFCIRDTGLIIGLTAGFPACYVLDRRLSDRRYGIAGFLLMTVTAAEWLLQEYVGSDPYVRFATAVVSGFGTAVLLSWMLYRNERDGQNVV